MRFKKKKGNVIQRFRKFWDGLSREEQVKLFGVLTALRNCDCGNNSFNLKYYTTARIRFLVLGKSTPMFSNGLSLNRKEIKKRDILLAGEGLEHFRNHFEYARKILKQHKIWKD